jgi:hypothetical protein
VLVLAAAAGAASAEVGGSVVRAMPAAGPRIPAGVREVDVKRGVPGRAPTVSVDVTQASKVREVVSLIDGLAVAPPGAYACPMIPAGEPKLSLTFRAGRGGAVIARASQLILDLDGTSPCDPLTVTVSGRAQISLLAGRNFLTALGRAAGVKLAPAK